VSGGVKAGTDTGESAEGVGKVGLIVVSAGQGEFGPGEVRATVEALHGSLEALDATVELRGDANMLAKDL